MAYHTQIFISRIEPNLIFSWLAAGLIEAFLLSLALSHTIISRILIVPLFLISVLSASASFVVSNEKLLDSFFTNKKVIAQLQSDISETQKEFSLGQKYTTKTLQRERQLKDELGQTLRNHNGDLTLINSFLFLVFVFILQLVSIYTAMSLKLKHLNRLPVSGVSETKEPDTVFVPGVSGVSASAETARNTETAPDTYTTEPPGPEVSGIGKSRQGIARQEIADSIRKIKGDLSLDQLALRYKVSKSTMSRLLNYPTSNVSDEVFTKVRDSLMTEDSA